MNVYLQPCRQVHGECQNKGGRRHNPDCLARNPFVLLERRFLRLTKSEGLHQNGTIERLCLNYSDVNRTGDKDVTEVAHNYFEGNQGVWGTFCAFLRRLRLFNA